MARLGRVMIALEKDLHRAEGIGPTERAHLRTVATALDNAAAAGDLEWIDRLSRNLLELRLNAGLSANSPAKPVSDPWDTLAGALAGPGVRHPG
jgi:hypothetical protein